MNKNYFTHLLAIIALLFSNVSVAQDSGISESYVIFNSSETATGNQFYDLDATTANPDFDGVDAGTNNAINALIFKGGQQKTFKQATATQAAGDQFVSSEVQYFNLPDENINLALLDDATLSGSSPDRRGPLEAILYDPSTDDYFIRTIWNEYGVGFEENIGRPDIDDAFLWQVDWSAPKAINYITFGGSYPNQPQPDALWRISYLSNNNWVTLEEGQGGWIDRGIYKWGGIDEPIITADALRVQIYSDGESDLVSILVRGRGGVSDSNDDSATVTKATLIQYLETSEGLSIPEIESQPINKMRIFPNPSYGETYLSFEVATGIKVIEIFDLAGRLVRRIEGDNIDKEGELIYIRALPDGVYILTAIDTSAIRYQEKLIINRN